jgi:hypothetical protein
MIGEVVQVYIDAASTFPDKTKAPMIGSWQPVGIRIQGIVSTPLGEIGPDTSEILDLRVSYVG